MKSDRVTGMILILNLVKYRSKFGNSSQQFTVSDGVCKHYTSKYRKMATEIFFIHYRSDDRLFLAAGGGTKRRYQYCTDISGIIYFRALQGHSGRNLIDPSLQDNVIFQSGLFQHIYHIGCAF